MASLDLPLARLLAARFWPGALTLVLPALAGLDETLTGGTGTVAVRVAGGETARALAREAGGALVSTSANVSGEQPPTSVAEISLALLARVDGILDGGPTPGGLPSTVVSLEPGALRLVRQGAIPFALIEVVSRGG